MINKNNLKVSWQEKRRVKQAVKRFKQYERGLKEKYWYCNVNQEPSVRLPMIEVNFGKTQKGIALLDSGSSICLLKYSEFSKLEQAGLVRHNDNNKGFCRVANQQKLELIGTCVVRVKIKGYSWYVKFHVAAELSFPVILGADFLRETGLVLNLSKNIGYFNFDCSNEFSLFEEGNESKVSCLVGPENNVSVGVPEAKERVDRLIKKYPKVFTTDLGEALDLEIKLKVRDPEIVNIKPYSVAPPKMRAMKEICEDLLARKIIQPSTSPYSSPTFLVQKPGTNNFRMVTNYAKVNSKIERVDYPLGPMQDYFDYLGDCRYYSVLDLNKSYYQVKLAPESRHLTAFSTPFSKFEFLRIPFGLNCGGQVLSSFMDNLFRKEKFVYLLSYLDDIIIFSKTLQDHYDHLETVIERLHSVNLTVNPSKVKFVYKEIPFLGHLVSHNNLRIDPSRTTAIRDFPRPRTSKEVSRFIGMVSFFSKHIKDYATIAACLNDLRRKSKKFEWKSEHEVAYQKLKLSISNPPVLQIPSFSKRFVLQTDASNRGAGGVLLQHNEEGELMPVSYYSKKFTDREQLMSVYEKEALSAVLNFDRFRKYLEVAEFTLEIDNAALSWVLAHHNKLGRLGRWVHKILSLKFTVTHIGSKRNVIADCLSRGFEEKEVSAKENPTVSTDVDKQKTCVVKGKPKGGANITEAVSNVINYIPFSFISIGEHQANDQEIKEKIGRLKKKENIPGYQVRKGLLMYQRTKQKEPRIVLPKSLVSMTLKYFHDAEISGHKGVNKTMSRVCRYFYWDEMKEDVRSYVRECQVCKMSKPAQRVYEGELVARVATRPLQKIYCDTAGPLVRSKSGNNTILILVDDFTKYVWLCAMRSSTADHIIKVMDQVIFRNYSWPNQIVSDSGPAFRSQSFRDYCFKNGVTHTRLVSRSPQGNRSERYLRSLRSELIAYYHEKQTSWDQNLSLLQLSLNLAQNEAHKMVPFELLHTYPANEPLTNLWSLSDFMGKRCTKGKLKVKFDKAVANLKESIRRNASRPRYSDKKSAHPFQLHSKVFLKVFKQSDKAGQKMQKYFLRYEGPYFVRFELSPTTFIIQNEANPSLFKRCHITQLKPG